MKSNLFDHKISQCIDHTLLKADANIHQIQELAKEAILYQFYSVCINPIYVKECAQLLKDSKVSICTVVGFPLGASLSSVKSFETEKALSDGADEIDMVINIGAIKSRNFFLAEEDIREVVTHAKGKKVKVIIETSLLNNEEKIIACQLATKAGAHFVKTSTGFNGGGATVEDVLLMKKNISDKMEVKASGGIKDLVAAKKLLEAGATRLGTSSGVAIVTNIIGQDFY